MEHLDKIVRTYRKFETVEKYAYRATAQELADNDFNLNIPRYVDTFEEEEEIDLAAVKKEIAGWMRGWAEDQFERRLGKWRVWCVMRGLPDPTLHLLAMPKRWGSTHSEACK